MCKSAKRTFEELGVEVYEIGALQCRQLFGWNNVRPIVCYDRLVKNRDFCTSMRKGAYLLVRMVASFGYQSPFVEIYGDGSVADAEWLLRYYLKYDVSMLSGDFLDVTSTVFQSHLEVWHLVDDDELWGDWERRVLDSLLTSTDEPACGDVHDECDGIDVAEDAIPPVVMYGSRASGSSDEYLCGVWVSEVGCYVTVTYSYPNFEVSCVDDWQGTQPTIFEECDAYGWIPWPYDAILEVDLPCEDADWEIVCLDGDEYCCTDLEDVRETLRRDHMIPLFAEYVGMYGDPTSPPEIYSPVAVVKVRACCL